jgi:hypothetical protein
MTLKIGLFLEDQAHKSFISPLLNRLIQESSLEIQVEERSVSGGHGAVLEALGQYLKDVQRQELNYYDAVVVGTDANCMGLMDRRKEVERVTSVYPHISVVLAIPDPHIERWFLLDSAAFKKVLKVGCRAPDQKCSRDRYKNELRQAVSQQGTFAPLGGIEYAEDIVEHLDMKTASKDKSFGQFVSDVRRVLKSWARAK